MTFSQMLRFMEEFGPITGGDPNDWANDAKNGTEFLRKGIRDNHSMQDGDVTKEKKMKISPDKIFGKLRKFSK